MMSYSKNNAHRYPTHISILRCTTTHSHKHTHIKINVMTNEFDFEMMRDSYRGGEFKLRAKLITENYWSEKIT